MPNAHNLKHNFTREERQEHGRKGAQITNEIRRNKKTLKSIFQTMGDTTALKPLQEQLSKLGFDVKDMTVIDAIVKIACARTFNKKTSMADIIRFIELYAKYTGQEPNQNDRDEADNGIIDKLLEANLEIQKKEKDGTDWVK